MTNDDVKIVASLVDRICAILMGHSPEVQSAALADLTAMWLAGMQDIANPESDEVVALRAELFALWCETTLNLVPINVARIQVQSRKRH